MRGYVAEAGRKPEEFGIEGRISMFNTERDQWAAAIEGWRGIGASHVSLNTMNAGLESPQQHIDAIRSFKEIAAG